MQLGVPSTRNRPCALCQREKPKTCMLNQIKLQYLYQNLKFEWDECMHHKEKQELFNRDLFHLCLRHPSVAGATLCLVNQFAVVKCLGSPSCYSTHHQGTTPPWADYSIYEHVIPRLSVWAPHCVIFLVLYDGKQCYVPLKLICTDAFWCSQLPSALHTVMAASLLVSHISFSWTSCYHGSFFAAYDYLEQDVYLEQRLAD